MSNNVKFACLVDNNYREIVELQKRKVLKKLKRREEKLFKAKPKNLKVKDIRRRRVWTPWGDIWLSRRRYFDEVTKSYKYLLDEYLDLEGRNYVPIAYRSLAIQNFHSFKSYKEIAKNVYNGNVSKQSIHNFIKNNKIHRNWIKKKIHLSWWNFKYKYRWNIREKECEINTLFWNKNQKKCFIPY